MIGKFGSIDRYKLPITALCFLVIVGLNLFLIQGSVFVDALAWICTVTLVSAILGLTSSRMAQSYLLFFVLGSLVLGVGLYESASVLLWLASSWSLGVLLLGRLHANQRLASISATEALLIGAAIWLAIWGGMLHFAVNYQSLHIILCLFPCLLLANRYSVIRNEVLTGVGAVQDWVRLIPFWAWVMGIAVIGWVLRWASFPSMGFDDHALHLRVWTELLTQHRYSFDVSTQVWSVAPITVDALHAGLSLMAGSDARSAMNLGLAILLLLLMAGIFRTWRLPPRTQWLLMVLMVSTPMLGWLLLSLQTELMLAVIALAGMRLVIDAHGGWRGQHVLGVLSCAALCASIKLPGAVLGITILCALAVRWWSQRKATPISGQMLRWPALLLLIPLSFLALHSYALAWKLTGNPVFPLYNAIFLSPYFDPINFSNPAYIHDFSFSNYVRVFFHTSEFNESGDYTAGWQYLIMLPIAILALLRSGAPSGLRIILIPLFGFGLVTFSSIQYWRYLFPVMPLAVVIIGSLFIQQKTAIRTTAFMLVLACIAANLFFFNRVSWIMNSPAGMAFTRDGKETLTSLYAPASLLTERVNKLAPGSRVLYTSRTPYGATLNGVPLYTNWYQPFRDKAYSSVKDFDGLRNFLSKAKADFAILEMSANSNLRDTLLREYMSKYGYVEGQSNNYLLYRISDTPIQYQKVFELQESEAITSGEIDLLLPVTGQGVTAPPDGTVLAVIPTHRKKQARYKVEFTCPSKNGYFVAQINWDKGAPYYRLVACETKIVTFFEAIPIPIGASQGSIYLTSRETTSIQVRNISVEVN
ncbi:MAG TPA: hypothetical protein V6D19_09690 [Stenomitos sp.]